MTIATRRHRNLILNSEFIIHNSTLSSLCLRIVVAIILLSVYFQLFAAEPLQFRHLSLKEGLSQSPIFSIAQSRKGFIWIGSRDGLIRFDGYEFKTYRNDKITGQNISHTNIKAIYEDNHENLWIGTSAGLFIFDQKKEDFTPIDLGSRDMILGLLPGENGELWVATNRGLKCIQLETRRLSNYQLSGQNAIDLSNIYITCLWKDEKKRLWLGMEKGIVCYSPTTGELIAQPAELAGNEALQNANLFVIKQSPEGNMWFGTEDMGAFYHDVHAGTCTHFRHKSGHPQTILSNFVRDIYIADDNNVWLATRDGLSIVDLKEQQIHNYIHDSTDPNSLSHNTIWQFMKDHSGNIWMPTYAGGINIFSAHKRNFVNIGERVGTRSGLNQPLVNSILLDPEKDELWVGTDGGGLNHVNREKNTVAYYSVRSEQEHKQSNIIKSLMWDRKKQIWIGTLDGVAIFQPTTKQLRYLRIGASNRPVRVNALLSDGGNVWAGTENEGLILFDESGTVDTTFTSTSGRPDALSNNTINALIKDEAGKIWIATRNGLNMYDPQTRNMQSWSPEGISATSSTRIEPRPRHLAATRMEDRPQHLAASMEAGQRHLAALCQDSNNRLWVGTMSGAYFFDKNNKVFHKLDIPEISDDVIQAIAEDNNGNIWFSTYDGLIRVEFLNFRTPFRAEDCRITRYTAKNGLSSNQFLPQAVTQSTYGELFWGGVNGVTTFFPDRIRQNTDLPVIAITAFYIHNEEVTLRTDGTPLRSAIEDTREITLNHKQGYNIGFKFAALNFIYTESNRYAYRMKGLTNNDDWNYAGNQRTVQYTNLAPGQYTFQVKAANNDGVWNENPVEIRIKVLPPLWKTWWAYLLYIIISLCILYYIIYFFRVRARLERSLFEEQLQNQRQEELNRIKFEFFTNVSHEIRTPLTLILAPLEKLESETHDDEKVHGQLSHIKNNAVRLLKLVNELLDFRKVETGNMKLYITLNDIVALARNVCNSFRELAHEKNITFDFHVPDGKIEAYFDKDQIEKVLYNLLSNAFKFTPDGGAITCAIDRQDDYLELRVTDNGKGVETENQKKIFQRFYQAEGDAKKGTGIGLAYSKSIVELHKGTIDVDSSMKQGHMSTTFYIRLQLGRDHFDANQLVVDDETGKKIAGQAVHMETENIESPATCKATILIVEDNAELRTFMKKSLCNAYHILEAEDGEQGWAIAIESIPDIIISDIMMPKSDGLELIRQLKQDDRTSHIPFIFLTARTSYEHLVEGLETGADLYLTKPFSLKILELNIHNMLAAREVMREKFTRRLVYEPTQMLVDSPDEKFFRKVLAIINENISNPEFDVPTFAVEIGMSQPILYKKIRALTNMSVNDFIKSIRLQKAAQLLQQRQYGIADIAYMVGFNDRKYFSKEFKKIFDKNPSEYMNSFEETSKTDNP